MTGISNSRRAKWTYHEERFFFEYLRMIKGMQIRDDCVTSIATALQTKNVKQVGAYYDNIITSMKRHLNTNIKKESSLENLHYTMVVYWERVMLPATETKYNKVVKSKDSKGDTGKKASQHHQQQQPYRSDAGNGNNNNNDNEDGQVSTGKKKTKKHKTAASAHIPGNGTSITPTESICIEDQNQIAQLPPPPAAATAAGAGAVASSGPLPVCLIQVRLVPASGTHLALMQKHEYSGAASMKLPAHTSLLDMLSHLETSWQRAIPPSTAHISDNNNGDAKQSCVRLYLEAGSDANIALQGVKWGGPHCNADLTIGDVVSLLPSPRVEGELVTLYYSWDLSNDSNSGAHKNGGVVAGAVVIPQQQQQQKHVQKQVNGRGIAPALPGEDPHDSLKRAIKAAMDHSARQKKLAAVAAAAVAAKEAEKAATPVEKAINQATSTPGIATTNAIIATVGQKRQRSELETELENALNGLDNGEVAAMDIDPQQQPTNSGGVVLDEGGERPAQRARVPVGLRNLLTSAGQHLKPLPAAKTKAKKSPKKKATSARIKKNQKSHEPSPALQSAQQLQQQQHHMQAMLSQQHQQQHHQQPVMVPAAALVGAMPLPAGMANYLQWAPGGQAQAQVLQGQQQIGAYNMQYALQQQQQLQQPPAHFYQQTPLSMGHQREPQTFQPSPPPQGGFTGGMNSLFGDSMFKSLFETPRSNHQPEQAQQPPQQQQQGAAALRKETEDVAMPISAAAAAGGANATGFAGAFSTPGKEPRTAPTTADADTGGGAHGVALGNDTISKLPIDWACLSPPPNFKLPPDFGTGGATDGALTGLGGGGASLLGLGGGGGHSLLPSTSLLGFMDAHPKAQGAAATVMQKGVEALFQQVGGVGHGGGDADEALAAEAAAAGGSGVGVAPTDTSLHSLDSLLEKSNSNWLAPFATAQGAATNTNNTATAAAGGGGVTMRNGDKKRSNGGGQQEDVPPVFNSRPFAALFGS
jgi:hypothetical protein